VHELKAIYIGRGLKPELAQQVAEQLMAHDALVAHAHDELGLAEGTTTRPLQAALISALTFSLRALLPLLMVVVFPYLPLTASDTMPLIATIGPISLLLLMLWGGLSAWTGALLFLWPSPVSRSGACYRSA
jgi:VIT1/CCC1 family predicted Fe2+/Mn2+ transporter